MPRAPLPVLLGLLTASTLAAQAGDAPAPWCEGEQLAAVSDDDDDAVANLERAMSVGKLSGRILDGRTGEGVGAAVVALPSTGLAATTDAGGRFEIRAVPAGPRGIEVQHSAYGRQRSCLTVPLGRSVIAVFTLDPEPIPLEPLDVRIEDVRPRWLEAAGFYHRMAAADGIFITRDEIADEAPSRLTELFRGRLGVTVRGGQLVPRHAPTTMLSQDCPVQYFVDGRLLPLPLGVNTFQPGDVEAIEAYFGAPRLPAQFNVGRAACGAVVIWLRIR